MSNYPEKTTFDLWSLEQQREFLIAVRVDKKKYEVFIDNQWMVGSALRSNDPDAGAIYRLAPEPEIDDSIDWSHVHPDIVKMVLYENWNSAVLYNEDGTHSVRAKEFTSYSRGNKPSCIVYRPGFEPK